MPASVFSLSLVQSLLEKFSREAPCAQAIMLRLSTSGFAILLDAPALRAVARATPAILRILSILPLGVRARARHAIISVMAQSKDSIRHLQGAGTVDAAARLVIDSKLSHGKAATADTTLGIRLLTSIIDDTGDHAVRSIFARDALLPALVGRVVHAAAESAIDGISSSALNLLVKLAGAGEDAAAYLASREDLLKGLTILARESFALSPTAICVSIESKSETNRPNEELTLASSFAVITLAHLATGGSPQRHAVAKVHGIFDVAFGVLKDAQPGIIQAASAKLGAAILESHCLTDLTTNSATVAASALEAAFSVIKVHDSTWNLAVLGHLIRIIDALSCHWEGANGLRSSQPVRVLVALLGMTAERHPEISEACAICIDSLCHDAFHVNCISDIHIGALLSALKLERTSVLLGCFCISILDHVARTRAKSVSWEMDFHGTFGKEHSVIAPAARRLAILLYADTMPGAKPAPESSSSATKLFFEGGH